MVLNVQGTGVTVKRIVLPGLPKLIHMLSRLV